MEITNNNQGITNETRLVDISVGQLIQALTPQFMPQQTVVVPETPKKILNRHQVIKIFDISLTTLSKWQKKKKIKYHKDMGSRPYFYEHEVLEAYEVYKVIRKSKIK